ncbi:MAG: O-methyltransferase [Verrucomicrobiae bacterium]|nr:O-methyltransferase [Verrucomicrobiae bacterium]
MYLINDAIDEYASRHSQRVDDLLQELADETRANTDLPIMLSSNTSANFLRMLVLMLKPKVVVELGMFTGFATLSMAQGLSGDGRVITCEVNSAYMEIAKKYIQRSPYGSRIEIREQPALELMDSLKAPVDLFFIDADKVNYLNYYEKAITLLRSGGMIAVDNCLWFGDVLDPKDEEARTIHTLNQKIQNDPRVDHVILTVKDGIHLVRKK